MGSQANEFLQLIYDELRKTREDVALVREEQSSHGEKIAGIDTRLAEQRGELLEMRRDLSDARAERAGLKVRSGIWGALAGLVPATLAMVLWLLSRL